MKLTKSKLKQIIKEELSKVLSEGDLPRYNTLPDERKDLGRAIVQDYFNSVKDHNLNMRASSPIGQAVWDAVQVAEPNRYIGKKIWRALIQKYPEEVGTGLGEGHPHWTTISWGVRKELSKLAAAIKNIPEEARIDSEILNRLRDDWVAYANELGVELGQSDNY